jgi:hypothetical protein
MVRARACLPRPFPKTPRVSSPAGLAAVGFLGLALSGCSLLKDRVEEASVDPVMQLCAEGKVTEGQSTVCVENETVTFKPINLDTFRFDDKPDELAVVLASGDKTYRNRLQALAFEKSIAACALHLRFAFASTALRKGALQFGAIATDAAAVLVGSVLAKESLAATSGVLTATDSIIDSVQFQNLLLASIMKAIDNDRQTFREQVAVRRDKVIAEYSLEEALGDVTDYHGRCSTVHGVMLLSKSVEEQQRNKALISDLERRQMEEQAEELASQIDQLDATKNKTQIEVLKQRLDRLRADLPNPNLNPPGNSNTNSNNNTGTNPPDQPLQGESAAPTPDDNGGGGAAETEAINNGGNGD